MRPLPAPHTEDMRFLYASCIYIYTCTTNYVFFRTSAFLFSLFRRFSILYIDSPAAQYKGSILMTCRYHRRYILRTIMRKHITRQSFDGIHCRTFILKRTGKYWMKIRFAIVRCTIIVIFLNLNKRKKYIPRPYTSK